MYLIDPDGKVMLRTVKAQKLAEQLKHLNYSKVRIPKNKRSRNPLFPGGERGLRYYLSKKDKLSSAKLTSMVWKVSQR